MWHFILLQSELKVFFQVQIMIFFSWFLILLSLTRQSLLKKNFQLLLWQFSFNQYQLNRLWLIFLMSRIFFKKKKVISIKKFMSRNHFFFNHLILISNTHQSNLFSLRFHLFRISPICHKIRFYHKIQFYHRFQFSVSRLSCFLFRLSFQWFYFQLISFSTQNLFFSNQNLFFFCCWIQN